VIRLKEKKGKYSKNNEIAEPLPSEETFMEEELQIGLKANLDYFGRSYSAYLYFLLIITITTTTFLLDISGNGSNNTIIRLFQPYRLNEMYLTIIIWAVFFIGLDFINIQYRDRYNKLLDLYYTKTGPIIIEKESYALKIFKFPSKVVAIIIIYVSEIVRSLKRRIKK